MKKQVGNMVEKVQSNLEDRVIQSFFDHCTDTAKEIYFNKKALEQAAEGIKQEELEEYLKAAASHFRNNTDGNPLFTEEELQEKFNAAYRELDTNEKFDTINKEELFKRFKLYIAKYTEYLAKELSTGERRLLERTAEISEKVLTKEDFEKHIHSAKALITIPDNQQIHIETFEHKHSLLQNAFDFAKDHTSFNEDDPFVLSFELKNIGKRAIHKLELSNLLIEYLAEVYDDTPSDDHYVLATTQYSKEHPDSKMMNIIPDTSQNIYIIFRENSPELEGDYYSEFFDFSDYSVMQIHFTLIAKAEKECLPYNVTLCVSKEHFAEDLSIAGIWKVDTVSMEKLRCIPENKETE